MVVEFNNCCAVAGTLKPRKGARMLTQEDRDAAARALLSHYLTKHFLYSWEYVKAAGRGRKPTHQVKAGATVVWSGESEQECKMLAAIAVRAQSGQTLHGVSEDTLRVLITIAFRAFAELKEFSEFPLTVVQIGNVFDVLFTPTGTIVAQSLSESAAKGLLQEFQKAYDEMHGADQAASKEVK